MPDLNLDCSFMPNGKWFVFRLDTGATVKKGLRDKRMAVRWIHSEDGAQASAAPPLSR